MKPGYYIMNYGNDFDIAIKYEDGTWDGWAHPDFYHATDPRDVMFIEVHANAYKWAYMGSL